MKRSLFLFCLVCMLLQRGSAQNPPWKSPLRMAWSADGKTFGPSAIFQDSAGVPCLIRWKGDTLAAVFQWFRQPQGSATWDRVAIKFSYDNGWNWTAPVPLAFQNMPASFQRPFDPALTVIGHDSLRVYFSTSNGMPTGGLDSTIDTYSAVSADGIHFFFENGPRVNESNNRVIDPSVILFNNAWHYLAPVGAPQQGAYHYISPDGFNFTKVPLIPSDNTHNWTGNYMRESAGELRFYGSGPTIWYNSSPNGGTWNGFVHTNIAGGDPSVLKLGDGRYLMVYVGAPYAADPSSDRSLSAYPNPTTGRVIVSAGSGLDGKSYVVSDASGKKLFTGILLAGPNGVDLGRWPAGIYFLRVEGQSGRSVRILKD